MKNNYLMKWILGIISALIVLGTTSIIKEIVNHDTRINIVEGDIGSIKHTLFRIEDKLDQEIKDSSTHK